MNDSLIPLSEIAQLLSVQPGTVRGYFAKGLLRGEKKSRGLRQIWFARVSEVVAFAAAHDITLDPAAAARLGISTGVRDGEEND